MRIWKLRNFLPWISYNIVDSTTIEEILLKWEGESAIGTSQNNRREEKRIAVLPESLKKVKFVIHGVCQVLITYIFHSLSHALLIQCSYSCQYQTRRLKWDKIFKELKKWKRHFRWLLLQDVIWQQGWFTAIHTSLTFLYTFSSLTSFYSRCGIIFSFSCCRHAIAPFRFFIAISRCFSPLFLFKQ